MDDASAQPLGLSSEDARVWRRWRSVRNTSADYGATTFDEFKSRESADWKTSPVEGFTDGIGDDVVGHLKREARDVKEGNLFGVAEDFPLVDEVGSFFKSVF